MVLSRAKIQIQHNYLHIHIITVYHRLQYLLPGESVKMADTTGSGVSQTFFFSKAFNECLPWKQK